MLLSLFYRMKGSGALLKLRIGAFLLGAVLGLLGIYLNISWLLTTAMIVLLVGILLRGLTARDSGSAKQEPTMHE